MSRRHGFAPSGGRYRYLRFWRIEIRFYTDRER